MISEDRFWCTQFFGGHSKPTVIAPLRRCHSTRNYGSDSHRIIFSFAVAPASHNMHNFGRLHWPKLVFGYGYYSVKNPLDRNVRWTDRFPTDGRSPNFDWF